MIKDKAREYLESGLSVVLTDSDKRPVFSNWSDLEKDRLTLQEFEDICNDKSIRDWIKIERKDKEGKPYISKGIRKYKEPEGLGIICGAVSGSLEVIDVDTKYDVTGTLWGDLKDLIEGSLPELSKELVIAQTKSGGYHIYYRCKIIEGNQKLANRSTTSGEKEETYQKELKKGSNEEAAKKISERDKERVLIETRGEGGYVIAPPTTGYKYIQGEPSHIPTISPQAREVLINICKNFNELEEEVRTKKAPSSTISNSLGLSPFEDYNKRGDVVELLKKNGWTEVSIVGERINVLRPGSTDSKTSGNYHTRLRTLRVWSSSAGFDNSRAYSPSEVFSLLECEGDNKKAERKLLELGYGESSEKDKKRTTKIKTEKIKVEYVNSVNKEISVISSPGEYLYLEDIQLSLVGEIVITSPSSEAQEEVLNAITLLQETGKKIYIKEAATEMREYRYQLRAIFNNYGALQEENGGLTDRNIDSLLDEVVIKATRLQPVDRDIFKKEFLNVEAVKELGISEESLSITVDKLTSTRDKEAQAKEFEKLLSEANKLQAKGETDKALELLDGGVKEVKLKDKKGSFSKLLEIPTEEDIKLHFNQHSDSLRSGFYINNEELLLPSGGLTGIAGATGHGKTDFLINLTLNAVLNYPEKEFYFFTYEMSQEAILVRFLNSYLDIDLESSSNQRAIKTYFKTGSTEYIKADSRAIFKDKVKEFFKNIIGSGRLRVKGIDYSAPELNLALSELSKTGKVGGFFIDYFQLLTLPKEGYKNYSRQEELKVICQDLNNTAKKLQLPIILGAQFNREVTTPFKLHPTNISEAGDIERILDTLIGIWFTNKKIVAKDLSKAEENDFKNIGLDTPGKLYTYVLKSRETATDVYELLDYNGQRGKIKNSTSPGRSHFNKTN